MTMPPGLTRAKNPVREWFPLWALDTAHRANSLMRPQGKPERTSKFLLRVQSTIVHRTRKQINYVSF